MPIVILMNFTITIALNDFNFVSQNIHYFQSKIFTWFVRVWVDFHLSRCLEIICIHSEPFHIIELTSHDREELTYNKHQSMRDVKNTNWTRLDGRDTVSTLSHLEFQTDIFANYTFFLLNSQIRFFFAQY